MTKKVRKPRSQSPRTYAQINPAAPASTATPQAGSTASAIPAGKKGVPTAATGSTSVDWAQEYHYVYQDLRRTFILAGLLLVLLIGLNVAFRLM